MKREGLREGMGVKVPGYLAKRRAGYEAVRDVPQSLRKAVGRKRLRKGLATQDVHLALARLLPALIELDARIRAASQLFPQTSTVAAEALALREQVLAVRSGNLTGYSTTGTLVEDRGEVFETDPMDDALGVISDGIQTRAEQIEKDQGYAVAAAYAAVALGRATPFGLHLEVWLTEGYRGRTLDDYRRIVEAFRLWLGPVAGAATLEAVTRRIAGRYMATLSGGGIGPVRVRSIVSALGGYWKWLERRGVLPDGAASPWARQAPAKAARSRVEPERAFTAGEVAALLAGTTEPLLVDLMHLAALSGLRIEEACRLTVAMCGEGVMKVPGTKTDAARRDVPIHSALSAMIERRCKDQLGTAYLFPELGLPNQYGDRAAAISKRFGRYRMAAGVHEREEGRRRSRVNFHSFRRWFITAALQAGQPLRVVQQVVGHKLQGMTEGVYFAGDTPMAKRVCIEAVQLPSLSVIETYVANA